MDASEKIESKLIHDSLFSDTKRDTIKHMRALEAILDELYARWDQWEEEHNI